MLPTPYGDGGGFSVESFDFHTLGYDACSVTQLDEFRVNGVPFGPHPHAGFCAVTYVMTDSQSGLRSRDSLGNDISVGPGGIIWTHAGRGLIHHELPAHPGMQMHGLQFFVKLRSEHKLGAPRVFSLDGDAVPVWGNADGSRVRVVAGTFEHISSPLHPVEPFRFFDAAFTKTLTLPVPEDHCGLLYLISGEVDLSIDDHAPVMMASQQAVTLDGGGLLKVTAKGWAHLLYLSSSRIDEPQVIAGPFMMNNSQQIEDAIRRYRNGEMGIL